MRGFTLIEVLVAIFLLTVGIVGVMAMFPLGSKITKTAQMASQAAQLGSAKMEELVSKSYDDTALSVGTTTEDYGAIANFNSFKRVTEVVCVNRDDLSEVGCDYDLLSDPEPMKKVEVTVFWRATLVVPEKSVKAVSLIAKR